MELHGDYVCALHAEPLVGKYDSTSYIGMIRKKRRPIEKV